MIPKEIEEIISYLSKSFERFINSPLWEYSDIKQQLYLYYFEEINNPKKVKFIENKNHWFIFFKCRLLDIYKKNNVDKKCLQKFIENTQITYITPPQEYC